jgi:hypothetical protein
LEISEGRINERRKLDTKDAGRVLSSLRSDRVQVEEGEKEGKKSK